jgi:CHASE1-domain containing sensor protein
MAKPTVQSVNADLIKLKATNTAEHHALEKKVDDLQTQITENRSFFTERLDRLDNRIWTIVILTLGSLLASVLSIAVGM